MSCAHKVNGFCAIYKTDCHIDPETTCAKYIEADPNIYYKCTYLDKDNRWCRLHDIECPIDSPECRDYHTYAYKRDKNQPKQYCKFCFNARVYTPTEEELMDPFATELTDENDSSSCGVGHCFSRNRRFMINSGHGHPVNIVFEEWTEKMPEWHGVGIYYPKHCPECGRRLNEYEMSEVHS